MARRKLLGEVSAQEATEIGEEVGNQVTIEDALLFNAIDLVVLFAQLPLHQEVAHVLVGLRVEVLSADNAIEPGAIFSNLL